MRERPASSWELVPRCTLRALLGICALGLCVLGTVPASASRGQWTLPPPPIPQSVVVGTAIDGTLTLQLGTRPMSKGKRVALKVKRPSLVIGNERIPIRQAGEGAQYTFQWTPKASGTLKAHIALEWAEGEERGPELEVTVLPDLCVRTQETLDFGQVAAGCEPERHCLPISFDGSYGLRGKRALVVTREAASDWESLRLDIRQNGEATRALKTGERLPLLTDGTDVQLCYRSPRCDEAPRDAQWHARITIGPAQEGLSDEPKRASSLKVLARNGQGEVGVVPVPNRWLACYLMHIVLVIGLLVGGLVIYGFVRPHGFMATGDLLVGKNPRKISQWYRQPLRSVPGGRRGWYRSARCSLDHQGYPVKPGQSAAVRLHAVAAHQIVVEPCGNILERKERGKWKVVSSDHTDERDALHDPFLVPGEIYRVNEDAFYFRVDL